MNLLTKLKRVATKVIDWLLMDEDNLFEDTAIEYDCFGYLVCQPVYVPVGAEGVWVRGDRLGRPIPPNIPSRIY